MTDEPGPIPARPAWMFLLVGIGGGILGLLPWLVTGARLPLQNVWDEVPASVPVVLLPYHPYDVTLVAALLLTGAAAAGVAARALGARRGAARIWSTLGGVLLVQVTAVVQTTIATGATMPRDSTEAQIWLAGLTFGASATVLVGVGMTALIARAPRAGAVIGLTVGAIAVQSWVAAFIVPPGSISMEYPALLVLVPWIAPVLAGAAIAWAGVGTVGRVIAALGAVALVWIGPALITAVWNALGNRVSWRYPTEMLEVGLGVFRAALLTPELALRPIITVAVVAAVGLGVRALTTRRQRHAVAPA